MNRTAENKADEELLKEYLAGDTTSFRTLVLRYEKPLLNYLAMVLRDRHGAEDLFQEVFLNVHKNLKRFDLSKRFKPWLYAIASNLAKDELRRRSLAAKQALDRDEDDEGSLAVLLEAAIPDAEEVLNRAEQLRYVRDLLENLPLRQREALALYYYEDLKYREIAEALNVPMGTVKSRLFAALETLIREFEKKFGPRSSGIQRQ